MERHVFSFPPREKEFYTCSEAEPVLETLVGTMSLVLYDPRQSSEKIEKV